MKKIGAIIQARVSSTRFPGKIMKELPYRSGITAIQQVTRRLKRSKKLNDIIIATTNEENDDEIVNLAKKESIKYFRGHKEDVLSRYFRSAKENNIDIIVRITSDCPCIDADIVDFVIEEHIKIKADYSSNCLKRSYPHGLDTELVNFNVLEEAYKNSKDKHEKEHVTPYIYKNPHIFKINRVEAPKELNAPKIRVTLDTEEDYALLCVIFDWLYSKNEYFDAYDLVNLFKGKPWLKLINKKVSQKKKLDTFKEELEEAIKILDLQDLSRVRKLLENYSK